MRIYNYLGTAHISATLENENKYQKLLNVFESSSIQGILRLWNDIRSPGIPKYIVKPS